MWLRKERISAGVAGISMLVNIVILTLICKIRKVFMGGEMIYLFKIMFEWVLKYSKFAFIVDIILTTVAIGGIFVGAVYNRILLKELEDLNKRKNRV